jgi:hypothetical protein
MQPQWFHSMCCVDDETSLKFISKEGYNQEIPIAKEGYNQKIPMADGKLSTWILEHPLSPTRWKWHLSQSVRIGDLWRNPLYNDLRLTPCFPVISAQQQHLVYCQI